MNAECARKTVRSLENAIDFVARASCTPLFVVIAVLNETFHISVMCNLSMFLCHVTDVALRVVYYRC